MDHLPSSIEAILGRCLAHRRGRDSLLLTRASESISRQPSIILVTSSLGPSGSSISPEHTPLGDNTFPSLSWTLPLGLEDYVSSYMIIIEDPDAPLPQPVVNVAAVKLLISRGGFRYGTNWGQNIWSGPRPILAHGEHRYFFQVIALKADLVTRLGNKPLTKDWLLRELKPHDVLAWGEWIGTCERRHGS
ncbi:PEBP-like protein [Penicillium malachiteum]|uniref:PEBP-like protein n=1 Tax=Penicillium malachiteum TaxID=1324776 RepID=UPI002547E2EE|nr:PEBP-like protein [Penicillium malachiteum]KAJ5731451.1 PEBP-like protein [Penicillium malachiteum]